MRRIVFWNFQELTGYYIVMEEYFMRESVMKVNVGVCLPRCKCIYVMLLLRCLYISFFIV